MRKLLAVLALVAGLFVLMVAAALPAFASAALSTKPTTTITLDAQVFAFLAGVVLPFLTAIMAKNTASSGTKAVINLILSGIAGTIAVLATNAGHAITAKELVIVVGTAWITAVATHFGLWKPTTLTPKVNDATGSFGFGKAYDAAA